MKLKLYTLVESKKLGIDNNKLTIEEFQKKLHEETRELDFEADKMRYYKDVDLKKYFEARLKFGQELLDVIQIAIAGIKLLLKDGIDLRILLFRHNRKLLKDREWEPDGVIKIDIENIK